MVDKPEILSLKAKEEVRTKDAFGKFDKQLKGIAGTLHLTREDQKNQIIDTACMLSKTTGLPCVVVVRMK